MNTVNCQSIKPKENPSEYQRLSDRRLPGELDDLYIQAFLKHPEAGKSAALRAAGYVGNYVTQRANEIHKRLAEQIDKELMIRMVENMIVGVRVKTIHL